MVKAGTACPGAVIGVVTMLMGRQGADDPSRSGAFGSQCGRRRRSRSEKVEADALSLYETIFELEAASKIPKPADEKVLLRSAWHWLTTLAVHANPPNLTTIEHR
jgi:hypothetical protein